MGANPSTLGLVFAFLQGRKMSVRLDDTYSVPRLVPGGSPQGSILGNDLFCSTTDGLTQNVDYQRPAEHSFASMSGGEEYEETIVNNIGAVGTCLLYTSPSPRDLSTSRMPSSA